MPIVECPTCHGKLRIPEYVAKRWVTCPRCLAGVENPGGTETPGVPLPARGYERDYTPDDQVRRDNWSAGGCLLVLAVLGLMGLIGPVIAAVTEAMHGRPTALNILGMGLLFVVLVAFGVIAWRGGPSGIGRLVVTSFAVAGALFAGASALGLAAFITLWVICMTRGSVGRPFIP
jgi:hypothetical protein